MHTAKPKYTFFRFYMVSESKGWFPAGTDCSGGEGQTKYCVKETDIIHTQFITRMCVRKQFFCQSPSPVTSSVRYISPLPECQMMKIINFGFSYWEMSKGKHGAPPPLPGYVLTNMARSWYGVVCRGGASSSGRMIPRFTSNKPTTTTTTTTMKATTTYSGAGSMHLRISATSMGDIMTAGLSITSTYQSIKFMLQLYSINKSLVKKSWRFGWFVFRILIPFIWLIRYQLLSEKMLTKIWNCRGGGIS